MKQQVREHYEKMRAVLQRDEQTVLDSLELDQRKTRTTLDNVLKTWKQHQDQVTKSISSTEISIRKSSTEEEEEDEV